jgi:hypothetical protein
MEGILLLGAVNPTEKGNLKENKNFGALAMI